MRYLLRRDDAQAKSRLFFRTALSLLLVLPREQQHRHFNGSSMHPMLNTAVKAARRGAAIINRASFDTERLQITEKSDKDFSTEVDQAAEQAIIEVLLKAYPDHAILAEESGASRNLHDENENVWIIDPLDGTTNFIHGYPHYCVSIALQQRGVITQAVVYDPGRNDLFTATKGAGTFLNDKRLRVTKHDRLANALISTGFANRKNQTLDQYMQIQRLLIEKAQSVRNLGAAALDLAYVAAGRFDGFCLKGLKPWDIAAGALLVTEAGGIVADFKGESDYLHKGDIIAASPKIYGQMLALLTPFA
jgi:myo-inositol-1(or 4)-monophosphatase